MKVKQEDIIIIINCILIGILFYIIISTPKSNEKIIKENINSVVEIENILDETVISKGTGIVIDSKYIITNYHVVKNNDSKVFINNYNATIKEEVDVVAYDEKLDLALLKFNNKKLGLNPIKICNDKQIIIGSNIITIGNAKGYGLSFNEGLISSLIKSLKIDNLYRDVIQISVPLVDGDSGGAVINKQNCLVGMMSFKMINQINKANEEISFAIPANTLSKFIKKNINK